MTKQDETERIKKDKKLFRALMRAREKGSHVEPYEPLESEKP